VIVKSLGYFLPSIYLPTFARSLGLSPAIGSLLIALLNGSAVFATIIMGMLCDRFHVTTVILLSTIGATISVFVFWGLSTALPLLCVFAVLYGFFAGGFVSTNAGVIKMVKRHDQSADVGMLLGVIRAGRGIGSVLSGPLSEELLRGRSWKGKAGLGYGSGYGSLIVFTGVTAAVGGLSFLGKRLGWIHLVSCTNLATILWYRRDRMLKYLFLICFHFQFRQPFPVTSKAIFNEFALSHKS